MKPDVISETRTVFDVPRMRCIGGHLERKRGMYASDWGT